MNEPDSMNVEDQIDERMLADVALVVEALAAFAGRPETLDTRRERRAWELLAVLRTTSTRRRATCSESGCISSRECCERTDLCQVWPRYLARGAPVDVHWLLQ